MTYRGNRLAAKLDRLALNPANMSSAPTFGRKAVLAGRLFSTLLLVLTLTAGVLHVAGHFFGYSLLVIATPLATAAALASPLRQASGSYRPDERERAMQLRAVLWGSAGTLTLGLFASLWLAWNTLSGGWIPADTMDFVAVTLLLVALPANIAALAAWLMTSAAGVELEFDDEE